MKFEKIYQIIFSVLSDEATDEERHIFSEWLNASEANKSEYEQLKRLHQVSSLPRKEKAIDIDQAWNTVKSQTINKKKTRNYTLWLRYAAMIALVVSIGTYFFSDIFRSPIVSEVNIKEFDEPTLLLDNGEKLALNQEEFARNQQDVTIKNDAKSLLSYESKQDSKKTKVKNNHLVIPKGKTYQLLLSDGTRIRLNSETELIYPTRFTGNKREVTLIGEAYFEVAKNKEKPFIVKANGMEVKVLGTTFNICSYTEDRIASTTLIEGSVAVQAEDGEEQTISPSEQFTFNRNNKKTTIRTVDTELYTSWINGTYVFKNTPLEDIMTKLQRWHDFSVEFEDKALKRTRYSLIVDKETTLEHLLEIISYTSDIKLERTDNNTIHIKKQRRENDIK